jgi:hypothetical protein
VRCWQCRNKKHLLESICPHCGTIDWIFLAVMIAAAILTTFSIVDWLPRTDHFALAVMGLVGAVLGMIVVPTSAGMVAYVLQSLQIQRRDAVLGPRWPSSSTMCRRCGRINVMPLFACRLCGRVHWVTLAVSAALAAYLLALVLIAQAPADSPLWWHAVLTGVRALARLLGSVVAFGVFIGIFELWKLQTRLPVECRVHTPGQEVALFGATALPVLFAVLLFLGLAMH